ncbi:hypothetical protein EVAR_60083_1 [Eumeta japonica]|uniref:Uncharacterized protein n=1 Tax=Eumeta variegata TaxID=151549 RepID=A0A4C1YL18_EUMVA|nr:hypothetical protein EVAR_60083_1 [Eumeta japonica]
MFKEGWHSRTGQPTESVRHPPRYGSDERIRQTLKRFIHHWIRQCHRSLYRQMRARAPTPIPIVHARVVQDRRPSLRFAVLCHSLGGAWPKDNFVNEVEAATSATTNVSIMSQ